MRNGGGRNSLTELNQTVGRRPAGGGVDIQIPPDRAVVRRNHSGHGHNGESAAEFSKVLGSELARGAKPAPDIPNSGATTAHPPDDPRLDALRLIARRMKKLPWTPALFALLLDELYIDDLFVKIIGDPDAIPPRDYARAVAVAIVLRHSWRPDDLEAVADRLGVTHARRNRHTRTHA